METTTSPLFDHFFAPDPGTLTEALFFHSRAIEDVLIAGGHTPGVGYTALDVVRIAATIMTAPDGADAGFKRWLLPEPEREEDRPSTFDENELPF
jgi:hypothetical protein